MKVSVQVETDSHLFENVLEMRKVKPTHLHWDIQVEVVEEAVDDDNYKASDTAKEPGTVSSEHCVKLSTIPGSSATPTHMTGSGILVGMKTLSARGEKGREVFYFGT